MNEDRLPESYLLEAWAIDADKVIYISFKRFFDEAELHIVLSGGSVAIKLKEDVATNLYRFISDRMKHNRGLAPIGSVMDFERGEQR